MTFEEIQNLPHAMQRSTVEWRDAMVASMERAAIDFRDGIIRAHETACRRFIDNITYRTRNLK